MPNIIINNYCNQKCTYCFAEDNMRSLVKKDMSLLTFIKVLKYLIRNDDTNVRILGGEPLLSKNIHRFISLSLKGGFDIIIFSNINIPNKIIKNIFEGLNLNEKLRINCNINNIDFYNKFELENIETNIGYLKTLGISLILGYNIYTLEKEADFIFELGKKLDIKAINLKITNSSLLENLIIDNTKRDVGIYIFKLIKKYHHDFFIEFSCGLDKNIFTKEELDYIDKNTQIQLKFGCEGNIGKFDINYNGDIFKCFPLQKLYGHNKQNLDFLLKENLSLQDNIKHLTENFGPVYSKGECSSNKKIKEKI